MTRIAIVIAAWNVRRHVLECLRSVARETRKHPYDVFVVDNGSSDGTGEAVESEFPGAVVLRNEGNEGFVSASNRGMQAALAAGTADYIQLLNADVVVRDGALDRLADFLDRRAEAGAAGPALVLPDGSLQPGPAGFEPSLGSGLAYFSFAFKIVPLRSRPMFVDAGALGRRNGGHRPGGRAGEEGAVRVDWISGACLMIRTDVVRRVGLMDEAYVLYADDIDWGVRMTRAGIGLFFLPGVRITHLHGTTLKENEPGVNVRWLARLFDYVRKVRGAAPTVVFRAMAAAGFGLRAWGYSLRAVWPLGASRAGAAAVRVRETAAYALFSLFGEIRRGRGRRSG